MVLRMTNETESGTEKSEYVDARAHWYDLYCKTEITLITKKRILATIPMEVLA